MYNCSVNRMLLSSQPMIYITNGTYLMVSDDTDAKDFSQYYTSMLI